MYRRMLERGVARSRSVELSSGGRVHLLEAGSGPPVLHLHGSNTSSLSHLPLLERLVGVRSLAVDRPGFGLSEPVEVPRNRFRDAAVQFVDEVLEALDLGSVSLVGGSMGGTWALWYALARPERVTRLLLLGSAPLLPGTRPPLPLRLVATPVAGDVVTRAVRPTRANLVRLMSAVGEAETIVRYPDLLDSLVVAAKDPVVSRVNRAELRAVLSPLRFKPSMMIRPEELRRVPVPTLLVWGDHDPVAGEEVARTVQRLLPCARLEILPAGHVPWLGHPDQVSELVSRFTTAAPPGMTT